ncbi:MAG: ABC transporter [Moorea sp. SIO2B7]|nr:ABC transporter [Moorena sp. SIO2B7]
MKNIANSGRYLKYFLFCIGLFLCIAGLVAEGLSVTWSLLPLVLLVTGIFIMILCLGFIGGFSKKFWGRRSTQAGTNALVATLAVLVILGLINFLAIRYSVRIDLTETKLYTLSPLSEKIVNNLSQPLKVWIFYLDLDPEDKVLLENYRRQSSNFEFEIVDPQIKIGIAEKFNVQSLGEIYVEYGEKKQLVQTLNTIQGISEVQLTNAMEKIQRDRPQSIYFLQGHGEPTLETLEGGFSQAVTSLEDKGYKVKPLLLAKSTEIPKDATVIVIPGPKRGLFKGEVKALKSYLNKGGSVLLMLDPETKTGLEPLFKDWGIQLDDRVIIDASGTGGLLGLGPATPLINNYGNHPITKDFANGISVYPLSRPIGTVSVEGVDAVALLVTNENTWAESNLNSEVNFNPDEDIEGPLDLAIAFTRTKSQPQAKNNKPSLPSLSPSSEASDKSKKPNQVTETPKPSPSPSSEDSDKSKKPNQVTETPKPSPSPSPEDSDKSKKPDKVTETPKPSSSPSEDKSKKNQDKDKSETIESKMVVFGSSTFATNGWFEQQLNGDVFLNSVDWLANDEEKTLSIRPKQQKNRRINITPLEAGIIGWMALLIMPLLGLISAGIAWWRRR